MDVLYWLIAAAVSQFRPWGPESWSSMTEQEARKVFSNAFAICTVLGGDIRQMCAERGVPHELVIKFLAEQGFWDAGLSKFDWDGSVKSARSERRQEKRVSVNIPATFTLENRPYTCIVLNMSTGGLLLDLGQQPDLLLSKEDTGKDATVVFGNGEKSRNGKIVRVLGNDNASMAAISVTG